MFHAVHLEYKCCWIIGKIFFDQHCVEYEQMLGLSNLLICSARCGNSLFCQIPLSPRKYIISSDCFGALVFLPYFCNFCVRILSAREKLVGRNSYGKHLVGAVRTGMLFFLKTDYSPTWVKSSF